MVSYKKNVYKHRCRDLALNLGGLQTVFPESLILCSYELLSSLIKLHLFREKLLYFLMKLSQ